MALLSEVSSKLFNWKRMENRCLTSIEQYLVMAEKMPNATIVDGETDNPYIYIEFGGDVLGVAHLDTHGKSTHFAPILVEGEPWVMCSQLDDRLGVFMLLDVLLHLGMKYDILLTTGEESGRSSAKKFKPPEGKDWNWMFECDRTGSDVVRYQYDDRAWEKMLESVGFGPVTRGSFTDICDLGRLGIAGFNMGIGYEDYHGKWAKANMAVCAKQTVRLLKFYEKYHAEKVAWEPRKTAVTPVATYPNSYGDWYGDQFQGRGRSHVSYGQGRFAKGDKAVLMEPHPMAGTVITITSSYPTIEWRGVGVDRKAHERYWGRFPDPKNPERESYEGFDDSVLGKFQDPEQPPAPKDDPPPTEALGFSIEGPSLPDRELVIINDLHYGGKAKGRFQFSEKIVKQRRTADGPLTANATWEARWAYELWLIGAKLLSAYSSAVVPGEDDNANGQLGQYFYYRDQVQTPEGPGTIVCTSPLMVVGYEDLYWVRLDRHDRHGFSVHLFPDSELTIIAAVRALTTFNRRKAPPKLIANTEDTQPVIVKVDGGQSNGTAA